MTRLRISAISYLNTAPLMWDFEHAHAGDNFDISYTIPSACAAALREGTADIGIIPSAAYAIIPNLVVIPGVAIAARRAVRSILLVSNVSLDKIRTVALDSSSLTSVALTKVLFAKYYGGGRTFSAMEPDLATMLQQHDAALLIGDPALQVDRARYLTLDLAEEWIRLTGKPFVFAFWGVRRAALKDSQASVDLASIFQESRDHGLQRENVDRIAREWAAGLRLTETEVRSYITENIHYYLDAGCLEGMQLFYRYAHEVGALPPAPPVCFVPVAGTVTT